MPGLRRDGFANSVGTTTQSTLTTGARTGARAKMMGKPYAEMTMPAVKKSAKSLGVEELEVCISLYRFAITTGIGANM